MLKAVADTNIFVSAYNFHGKPEEVLILAQLGFFELYISAEILREFEKVVAGKMAWSADRLEQTLAHIYKYCHLVQPTVEINAIQIDPSDNRILECAATAGADVIITGDERHLLKLQNFGDIKIIKPSEFLRAELWKL